MADLDAIVVSHEHIDHVRGLQPLSRQLNLPVYINSPTLLSIKKVAIKENVREFETGRPFSIRDFFFEPFSVPHDAADPVGFTIRYKEWKIGIATDLGFATKLVIERLKNCDILILESNHDEEMLQSGPYPWEVKQRVKGRLGHLSNHQAASLIKEVDHGGLKHIILFHISETNNSHEKATEGVNFLSENGHHDRVNISLALQHRVGKMISASPENKWM